MLHTDSEENRKLLKTKTVLALLSDLFSGKLGTPSTAQEKNWNLPNSMTSIPTEFYQWKPYYSQKTLAFCGQLKKKKLHWRYIWNKNGYIRVYITNVYTSTESGFDYSRFSESELSGVARLDGARGKKQVWRPHVRTWGLSEEDIQYWRKYLWHCWDFSASPVVIRFPPQLFGNSTVIRRPGSCFPLPPRYVPAWTFDLTRTSANLILFPFTIVSVIIMAFSRKR